MKNIRSKISNILFVIILALLLIPQTRKPIQVFLNKGLAQFGPSIIDKQDRVQLIDYNWNLITENNSQFNLNEVKGKILIINFWATWCPPCIAEMDSLEELYGMFSENRDVVFLFVTNDPIDKTNFFKEKNGYTFPVYRIVSKVPELLRSSSIPQTFVLDKDGTIVIDKTGASNWSSKKVIHLIESLLVQ